MLVLIAIAGFAGTGCSHSLSLHPVDEGEDGSDDHGVGSDDGEDGSSTASDELPATSFPPDTLVINEVLYDSIESDGDGNVFIELYGSAGGDLSGYVLRLINGADGVKTDEIVFPAGSTIPDDGFFVVADSKTGNSSETNVADADFIDNFDPQNGPDSIQLINSSGNILDVIGYGEGLPVVDADGKPFYEGSPAITVAAGESLSRLEGADTGNNAVDFVANQVPSPGNGEIEAAIPAEPVQPVTSAESEGSAEGETEEEAAETDPVEPIEIDDVHFTEVVTDPQQDWNDTAGGNGIVFDSLVGNGTIGTTDEWIEIKNGRDETVDLTLWRLEMMDGTDAAELFSSSSASLVFFGEGDVDNFQPDEFLVVGNPAGDMKNAVTLQLFDETSFLVDELVIDDANAAGVDDESYQLLDDGNWGMGEATPGF